MNEDLADAERQQLARRGLGVAVRELVRHPAEKPGNGALRAHPLRRFAQIRNGRECDHRQLGTLRRPERQLSSRRMADQDDSLSVERVALDELAHVLGRRSHVVARGRPPTVDVADAAVLDVPGRDPGVAERHAEMARMDQVVHRLPRAPVHDDGKRRQPVDVGEAKVAELLGLGPVSEPCVRGAWRPVGEDFLAVSRHHRTRQRAAAASATSKSTQRS